MLLQEEYLKRHGIAVPVVNHTLRDGCLLVRNKKPERFLPSRYILDVKWVDEGNHPGNYHISLWRNVHDATSRREHFQRLTDPQVVAYDEYEKYLFNWVAKEKVRSTSTPTYEDAVVYMWDLFISSYDSWFVKSANSRTMQHVEATLDGGDGGTRMPLVMAALNVLRNDNSSVYDRWETGFLPYAKKNFHWLSRMLNGE